MQSVVGMLLIYDLEFQSLREGLTTLTYFLIHKCGAPVAKVAIASSSAKGLLQAKAPRPLQIIKTLQMLAIFFKEDINLLIVVVQVSCFFL